MTSRSNNLITRLNDDLAGEFGAIIQYLTYAAKVTGPYRRVNVERGGHVS